MSSRYKNNKFVYYLKNYIRQIIPNMIYSRRLSDKLRRLECADKDYILSRVNYYNKLDEIRELKENFLLLSEFKLQNVKRKVYFFDTNEYTRYFPQNLKISTLFGDITTIPNCPQITKSRPIEGNNKNSVILKLNKIRHFLFINDPKKFEDKKDMLVFRGEAMKNHRMRFLKMYFSHPLCDIGHISRDADKNYSAARLTIPEHLNYKFIMCLEGNDVATNLKWVMSSNSIAVMPRPKYETWFMEGTLIPNYHYVLIKDDYSDLEERLNYYIQHTDEALKIQKNAHEYVDQFKNKKREDLINLLVLKKYFEKTKQSIP